MAGKKDSSTTPPTPDAGAGRDSRGRWLKGATPSGAKLFPSPNANTGGLPKWVKAIRELAASHGPSAVATLAKIMGDEEEKSEVRVAAATALLDRAGARPIAVEGDKLEVTTPDVEALRAQLAERVVRMLAPAALVAPAPRTSSSDTAPALPAEEQRG